MDDNKRLAVEAAIKAAAVVNGEFVEKLIEIADKYGLNRTEFIRLNAGAFYATIMTANIDLYKSKKGENV